MVLAGVDSDAGARSAKGQGDAARQADVADDVAAEALPRVPLAPNGVAMNYRHWLWIRVRWWQLKRALRDMLLALLDK